MKMGPTEYNSLENLVAKIFEEKKLKVGIHKVAPVRKKFELYVPDRPDLKASEIIH